MNHRVWADFKQFLPGYILFLLPEVIKKTTIISLKSKTKNVCINSFLRIIYRIFFASEYFPQPTHYSCNSEVQRETLLW